MSNQNDDFNHPARRHPALTFLLCGPAHIMSTRTSVTPTPASPSETRSAAPPHASPNAPTAAQIDEQARQRNAAAQARCVAHSSGHVPTPVRRDPLSQNVSNQTSSQAQGLCCTSECFVACHNSKLPTLTDSSFYQLEQSVSSLRETLKHATTESRLKELEEENKRLTAELAQLRAQLEGGGSDDGHGSGWPVS